MASLLPPSSLNDSCSIIFNGTLYVYTPQAFLSLPLHNGTSWNTLPSGASTSGARCVRGFSNGPGSEEALWVVGGASQNTDYPGLQRYSFSNASWTTITPVTKVTQNRRGHGATFLRSTGEILVYAGSQDDPSQRSIETFTISTMSPYTVLSYISKNTPVVSPILLPWTSFSAITIGGNVQNRNIAIFDKQRGWSKYATQLPAGLKSIDQQRATIVVGGDQSKVLELYDMSVSPNLVTRLVLQNANGLPAQSGFFVGGPNTTASASEDLQSMPTASLRKRAPTLESWPAYNSSEAPTYTRNAFSIAVTDQGLTAITGGNDQHPIALFDEAENSWIDASRFFGANVDSVQSFLGPTATSVVPTSSSTSGPTSSSSPGPPHHSNVALILGATLGSILGAIALLIIILLLLRYRRIQKQRQSGYVNEDEKRRLSFADRGDPTMMEHPSIDNKHTSIAIMTGRIGPKHTRGGDGPGGSDSSTARLVPPKRGVLGPHDAMEMETIVERSPHNSGRFSGMLPKTQNNSPGGLAPPKRSSGWSRYFSGSDVGVAGARSSSGSKAPRKSARSAASDERASSRYSFGGHDCQSHGPTQLPPLNLGGEFETERLSAAVGHDPKTGAQRALEGGIPRGGLTSSYDRPITSHSRMSSHAPTMNESLFSEEQPQHNHWTPVTGPSSDWGSQNRNTGISSVYSEIPGLKSPMKQHFSELEIGRGSDTSHSLPQFVSGATKLSETSHSTAYASQQPRVYSDVDYPGTQIPLSGKGTDLDAISRPEPVLANGPRREFMMPQIQGDLNRPSGSAAARAPSPVGLGMSDRVRSPSPSSAVLEASKLSPSVAPDALTSSAAAGVPLQRPFASHVPASSVLSSQLSGLSAFPQPGTGRPGSSSGRNSPVNRKPVEARQPMFIVTPSATKPNLGNQARATSPLTGRPAAGLPHTALHPSTNAPDIPVSAAREYAAAMSGYHSAPNVGGSARTPVDRSANDQQFSDPRSTDQRTEDSSFFGARGVDRVPIGQHPALRPQEAEPSFGRSTVASPDAALTQQPLLNRHPAAAQAAVAAGGSRTLTRQPETGQFSSNTYKVNASLLPPSQSGSSQQSVSLTSPITNPVTASTPASRATREPLAAPPTNFAAHASTTSHDSIDSAAFFGGAPEARNQGVSHTESAQTAAGALESLPIPKFSNAHDSIDSASAVGQEHGTFANAGPLGRLQGNPASLHAPMGLSQRDSIDTQMILGNGSDPTSKVSGTRTAAGNEERASHEATVVSAPMQPQGQRASMVEEDDDFFSDDELPHVVTVATSRVPTAVTAIPVPASTAMQYTVKKPGRSSPGANEQSWPL